MVKVQLIYLNVQESQKYEDMFLDDVYHEIWIQKMYFTSMYNITDIQFHMLKSKIL